MTLGIVFLVISFLAAAVSLDAAAFPAALTATAVTPAVDAAAGELGAAGGGIATAGETVAQSSSKFANALEKTFGGNLGRKLEKVPGMQGPAEGGRLSREQVEHVGHLVGMMSSQAGGIANTANALAVAARG